MAAGSRELLVQQVDADRMKVVLALRSLPSLIEVWPIWLRAFAKGTTPWSADRVLGLGRKLSVVFKKTATAGRGQAQLSVGGTAWEGLVCWYLNLCLIGTTAVVYKRRSDVPEAVRDGLAVSYGNVTTNSESDLVAVTYPTGVRVSEKGDDLPSVAEHAFGELRVSVIQCKTNWNDNAQIPMLWDMVYRLGRGSDSVQVGSNNRSFKVPSSLTYALVTVPTTDRSRMKESSLNVLRVSALSGGNYWGYPTENGIAKSLNEIFPKARIGPEEGRGLRHSLSTALPLLGSRYAYFGLRT